MKKRPYLLRVAACILLAMLLTVPAAARDARQLRFPADGKLKIAVFADLQTTQNVPRNLTRDLSKVLDDEQPDLVIFLGDQVEGKHPWVHLGDNEAHVKSIIDQILTPVVEREIPFAVVFGNHDAQDSGVSKELQMDYYMSFPGCLAADEGDALPGCGTYELLYYSSDGTRPALNLYLVDSLEYDAGGGYGCVSKEQIAWDRAVGGTWTQINGGTPVPAMVFQHIVVPEVYNAFTQVRDKKADGAFAGKGVGKGNWYAAPAGMDGLEEAPCPPEYSNGQFAAWREVGDVKAAFFGHDHVNSFAATLDGIDLVACPGATYTSYNDEDQRGVRIIEIDERTIAEGIYETHVVRFKDSYGAGFFAAAGRFFGSSHMWELEIPVFFAVLAVGNAIFWPVFLKIRKKKAQKSSAGKKS